MSMTEHSGIPPTVMFLVISALAVALWYGMAVLQ